MMSYLVFFHVLLLTRNHMIFSHAIWNKQVLVNFFKKPQIALALQAHTILLVFKKIYLHLFTAFILTNQN